jgi:hypothetical protein
LYRAVSGQDRRRWNIQLAATTAAAKTNATAI